MRKIICAKDYFEKLSEKGVVLFGGGSKARQAIEVLRKKKNHKKIKSNQNKKKQKPNE